MHIYAWAGPSDRYIALNLYFICFCTNCVYQWISLKKINVSVQCLKSETELYCYNVSDDYFGYRGQVSCALMCFVHNHRLKKNKPERM